MEHAPPFIAQDDSARWMTEFEPFGLVHLIVFVAAAVLMIGTAMAARRWRSRGLTQREWRLRLVWSLLIVVSQIATLAWYMRPGYFRWDVSLPLHISNLVAIVAPFALLTQRRALRTVLYFWGVGLSTQAFFTPIIRAGAGEPVFWLFWVGHTQIVGSALYDIVALGYRPGLRDLRDAVLVSVGYVAVVTPLNYAFGWNYGFTGPTRPDASTLLDRLGDWPERLIPLTLLGLAALVLAWAPWALARRWTDRTAIERSRTDATETDADRDAARRD